MPTRFVGRAAEVGALAATIDLSLRSPGPAALLVTGDAGSGKSRLLSEGWAQPLTTEHPASSFFEAGCTSATMSE